MLIQIIEGEVLEVGIMQERAMGFHHQLYIYDAAKMRISQTDAPIHLLENRKITDWT